MTHIIQLRRVGEHTLPVPAPSGLGDFGYDVATPTAVVLRPSKPQLVGIGFALASPLPPNVALLVLPRSSTRMKLQLTIPNSPGLVDRYYGEELKVQVELAGDESTVLEAGTRFAQLLFVPVVMPEVREVSNADPSMTRSGFGSTG